jgi:prevent-host-death family protein
MKQCLSISEARRQLSRLVSGVTQGGGPVTITQHGKEQATLISTAEYQALSRKARAFERSQDSPQAFTVRGSLELCCSPEELEDALAHRRRSWAAGARQSATALAREIGRS